RIVLDVRAEPSAGEPWEREIHRRLKPLGVPTVVRTSPVRPRCERASFTLPLRITEVNSETGASAAQSVQAVFGPRKPSEYDVGVTVASSGWAAWSAARSATGSPGA